MNLQPAPDDQQPPLDEQLLDKNKDFKKKVEQRFKNLHSHYENQNLGIDYEIEFSKIEQDLQTEVDNKNVGFLCCKLEIGIKLFMLIHIIWTVIEIIGLYFIKDKLGEFNVYNQIEELGKQLIWILFFLHFLSILIDFFASYIFYDQLNNEIQREVINKKQINMIFIPKFIILFLYWLLHNELIIVLILFALAYYYFLTKFEQYHSSQDVMMEFSTKSKKAIFDEEKTKYQKLFQDDEQIKLQIREKDKEKRKLMSNDNKTCCCCISHINFVQYFLPFFVMILSIVDYFQLVQFIFLLQNSILIWLLLMFFIQIALEIAFYHGYLYFFGIWKQQKDSDQQKRSNKQLIKAYFKKKNTYSLQDREDLYELVKRLIVFGQAKFYGALFFAFFAILYANLKYQEAGYDYALIKLDLEHKQKQNQTNSTDYQMLKLKLKLQDQIYDFQKFQEKKVIKDAFIAILVVGVIEFVQYLIFNWFKDILEKYKSKDNKN